MVFVSPTEQGVGISVEFCSHLVRCYAICSAPTRVLRAKESLAKMGTSVCITTTFVFAITGKMKSNGMYGVCVCRTDPVGHNANRLRNPNPGVRQIQDISRVLLPDVFRDHSVRNAAQSYIPAGAVECDRAAPQ
jgi:hypothetical protein